MAPDYTLTWHGNEIYRDALKRLGRNAERAARVLETYIVKSISRTQPTMTMPDGSLRGLDPSLPGEPPKIVSTRLRNSIDHRVSVKGSIITLYVSAGTNYAKQLEWGQPKALPKKRPFMRPALDKNRKKMLLILTKGLFQERKAWDKRRLR